ncbi:MAG: 3-oxoacyl-ACP reductase [Bradymonadia bacterium]
MSDTLVELSTNPWFRQGVKQLGLPIPTPQKLKRSRHARTARPLTDMTVEIRSTGALDKPLAAGITAAGANVAIQHTQGLSKHWQMMGEAHGQSVRFETELTDTDKPINGLIFDATDFQNPSDLRALYEFFNPRLSRLARCGRIVVLGRPPEELKNPARAAAHAGLDGFVRSIAREVGRKGATANVVYVAQKAEGRAQPLIHFLMSPRSAFISGQPWRINRRVTEVATDNLIQPLENRLALVTGAARGIGAATARLLAAEGAHVICLDRPGDEDVTSRIAGEVGGTPLMVDITAENAAELIQNALDGRKLDVLIHNAGITRDKTLARMRPEWWDQAVDVNLGAVIRINEHLFDEHLADKARIVCLSSVAGLAGNVGQTNYAASKAGIVGYVRSAAPRLSKRGIAINAVAPGFIETRLTQAIPVVTREAGRRMCALGQGGEPHDVAELISFLATPGGGCLTGQVMRACGGMFLGA